MGIEGAEKLKKYWLEKWATKDIRFHQADFNSYLINFFPKQRGSTFVPLCGKSKDMHWLAEHCGPVVGVEFCEVACREFFEEANLPFQVESQGAFSIFRGEKVTLWCGDLFELPATAVSHCSLLYDRASYIALSEQLRARYLEKLRQLFSQKEPSGLLITLRYDQALAEGPPFSISRRELEEGYGRWVSLSKVAEVSHPSEKRIPKFASLPELTEIATAF